MEKILALKKSLKSNKFEILPVDLYTTFFISQRCNTQMLRSSHKKMSLNLTIISCVAATTHKFVNNMWASLGIPPLMNNKGCNF